MIKNMCPVCDQEMDSRNYCKNCRSWVKTPNHKEIDYYLNQNHPDDETTCTYHEYHSLDRIMNTGQKAMSALTGANASTSKGYNAAYEEEKQKGKTVKKPISFVKILVWILVVINVIIPLFGSLLRRIQAYLWTL